jgi:Peptidase family M28
MMSKTGIRHFLLIFCMFAILALPALGQPAAPTDPIAALVQRLDLEKYKTTIKALTRFGDRRQGTARNRAAIDWIEARLKSYGCTNTERVKYEFGVEGVHQVAPVAVNGSAPHFNVGGARARGYSRPTGVNIDPNAQPDAKLRALDAPPAVPGLREEVYCTKIGTTHPNEMYLVTAHMDGIGFGEAANDNGSGTALVMEVARIMSSPDVLTDRSIRFILWNNEETGLNGAAAYVAQRQALQGKEMPPGSGRYPEPKWLGMIQHDMMMFDHGMPRKDGSISQVQRPEADVNIEYQVTSKLADQAMLLAHKFQFANEKYATDYPAAIGAHMSNTDSGPFMDLTPSISLRELERGSQIGNGWDPNHHQPTDVYAHYSDDDFRLGLNAAQTTLAAVAQLTGAKTAAPPVIGANK